MGIYIVKRSVLYVFTAAVLGTYSHMMPTVRCLAATSVLLQKVAV